MRSIALLLTMCLAALVPAASGQEAGAKVQRPKVLIFYSLNVENDHVLFALDALRFYADLARKDNFVLDATTDPADLNDKYLRRYQLVVWLNTFAQGRAEREAFERYMTAGGAWLGGYNLCNVASKVAASEKNGASGRGTPMWRYCEACFASGGRSGRRG